VVSFVMLAVAHSITMLFLARIVDGLSGGNISTARAYVADITEPKDRARAYGLIGAAFGLGFILGPALSGILSRISYTAPIWAAAGVTLLATAMAWLWLPETVHRARAGAGNPFRYLPALLQRPLVRRVLVIDFVYWCAFAIFQTTFALFAARRFSFDVARTGYFFAAFGVLGAVIQGGIIRPVVRRLGDRTTFAIGLGSACSASSRRARALGALFALALVPLALGIGFGHPTMSSLVSLVARGDEQGACRARQARSRASAGRSARSGETPRSSTTVNRRPTSRRGLSAGDPVDQRRIPGRRTRGDLPGAVSRPVTSADARPRGDCAGRSASGSWWSEARRCRRRGEDLAD
jgi:DHA1 family tetracycline resistance protein-like MFS transporter